jgi:hypothetical protein
MLPVGKLLAWIEPRDYGEFVAAFVGAAAARERVPATQPFLSRAEARQWIEDQAAALGLPIEWVPGPPGQ